MAIQLLDFQLSFYSTNKTPFNMCCWCMNFKFRSNPQHFVSNGRIMGNITFDGSSRKPSININFKTTQAKKPRPRITLESSRMWEPRQKNEYHENNDQEKRKKNLLNHYRDHHHYCNHHFLFEHHPPPTTRQSMVA